MKLLNTILLLISTTIYSQGSNLNYANEDKSYLPNVTPPSPNSFAITEYGKNKINEFNGKLNISIPIYTYSAGELNLPITLNYSGAGVKVNDISTWTGINWTLVAGGVINRRINDCADESPLITRKYIDLNHLLANADNTCAQDSQFYYNLSYFNERYDTEVDVFNFSFNGYSGSFYLDDNFNPIYIENENELKIEIIGDSNNNKTNLQVNKTFLITTPDGIKYYFGGIETEQTMVFSGSRENSQFENTSFYLYKIEHPINGTILFEYTQDSMRMVENSKSYSMYTVAITNNLNVPFAREQLFVTRIVNSKRLKKIRSLNNSVEVLFNEDIHQGVHFISSLNNIQIKSDNNLIKKINFFYDAKLNNRQLSNDFSTASRFFLNKIEINNGFDSYGNKHEVYKFEYNDPFDLPTRLSNSQDILGFYNGKYNLTLIPNNPFFNGINSNQYANRDPEFGLASKGALTKITYPTKGFSTFEYEPGPAKEKVYKYYKTNINLGQIATIPGNVMDEITGSSVVFSSVYKTQSVLISISSGIDSSNDSLLDLSYYQANHSKKIQLTIMDVTPGFTIPNVTLIHTLGMNPNETLHNVTFIKDHVYQIEFKFLGNWSSINTTSLNILSANFNFKLFNGYKKIEGFGVRIKRQMDFTANNTVPNNSVRYYYYGIDGASNNVELFPEINYSPKYSYSFDSNYSCNPSQGGMITIFSEPSNKYCNDSNEVNYPVVSKSYGGDNYENGGEEKYYFYEQDLPISRIKTIYDGCLFDFQTQEVYCGAPREQQASYSGLTCGNAIPFVRENATSFENTNLRMYNGKLIGERIYKSINQNLFKTSETIYNYEFFSPNSKAVNFVGRTLFGYEAVGVYCNSSLTGEERKPLSSCYIGYYTVDSFKPKLISKITKNYIDPIPINIYYPMYLLEFNYPILSNLNTEELETPYKKITTTQTFEYGTLKGLPTKITTDTSNGDINSTVNTYVNQSNTLTGLSAPQVSAYSNLLASNRVASPIEVKQFRNSDLLSKQRTVYKEFSNNHFLPETIQTAKGDNPLEVRAIFEEYDDRGNPTLVLLKDGTKTKYIYNSNNQVVAKIENFTGNATSIPTDPCQLITNLPNSLVTLYNYDSITQLLTQIIDSNCRKTTYLYDELHRLKQIIDHDGNVIKEFDNNYRPN